MITENHFFYVLKDIAVSLREIAYVLKNNNQQSDKLQHKAHESIAAVETYIKDGVAKELKECDDEIKAIANSKPTETEKKMYSKPLKPQPQKASHRKKPFKKPSASAKQKDGETSVVEKKRETVENEII